jgi:hypothetical protein
MILPKLRKLIASTKLIIQVLGIVFDVPSLCQLSVEGEGGEPQSLDSWELCTGRAVMKEKINHLTLSGSSSEEQTRTHFWPKFTDWTRIEHLVLQGDHYTPVVEAMTVDRGKIPNLMDLSLVETNIPGEVLEKLIASRNNQDNSGENGARRIQKLTLDGCKGIDRNTCEVVTTMVDKMIVRN